MRTRHCSFFGLGYPGAACFFYLSVKNKAPQHTTREIERAKVRVNVKVFSWSSFCAFKSWAVSSLEARPTSFTLHLFNQDFQAFLNKL